MDNRGYWHDGARAAEQADRIREVVSGQPQDRPRFVIELEIGSTVEVVKDGEKMLAVFESVDKNKVTLRPIDEAGKTRPYLGLANRVELSNGSDPGVPAQVWDNRDGKLILRTLPVS